MNKIQDTIAAYATPIGEGGIGIVRISGRNALVMADQVFRAATGTPIAGLPTHTAHYGYTYDPLTNEPVDDGVLTIFRAPRSYTGEDSVEISCHGGIVPMRLVLGAVLEAGARLAEPGEFTKRAFLNGRLDLAQAEAVLDIIRARTDDAMRVARRQFAGVLSTRIRMLRDKLIGIMAHIEASIDFPEDVEDLGAEQIADSIRDTISHVEALLDTADRGMIYREGIVTVIVGRPNVGKSSLLNALLRESRAIVTPIPGTTRDIIEESLNIRGIPIRTIDTAGVRETEDVIERMGVDRARRASEEADLVLMVLDAGQGFTPDDQELLSEFTGRKAIIVLNKSDLLREADLESLQGRIQEWMQANLPEAPPIVLTAAPSNEGIIELEETIAETILQGGISSSDGAIISNIRHRRALEEALASLGQALRTARFGMPHDFISLDLKAAIDALGSITGETVAEDVIDRIFSEFCIGK
jgi:tRNA modification GTPase